MSTDFERLDGISSGSRPVSPRPSRRSGGVGAARRAARAGGAGFKVVAAYPHDPGGVHAGPRDRSGAALRGHGPVRRLDGAPRRFGERPAREAARARPALLRRRHRDLGRPAVPAHVAERRRRRVRPRDVRGRAHDAVRRRRLGAHARRPAAHHERRLGDDPVSRSADVLRHARDRSAHTTACPSRG